MPCYSPLSAFRSKTIGKSGKRGITFNPQNGYTDMPLKLPCGQCIGCRLERSRQWALRCTHEAQLYENNCFITLTYNNENLPLNHSLNIIHFQKFMKRLRKHFGTKIRFYHCGEYGEKNLRPHYHAILFNHDFADKIHYQTKNDNQYYTSATLEKLWPFGFSIIGDVTFESAAYVARYCLKKVNGENAEKHYERLHPETGEIIKISPEYATMSRRPGIGMDWYKKYKTDVFPSDFIIHDGIKMAPPKFYDRQLEKESENQHKKTKGARIRKAKKHSDDNTPRRLADREKIQLSRINRLKRGLENE